MSKHRELAVKTMELQMECMGEDRDPYSDQVLVIEEALKQVERETWEKAAAALDRENDRCWGLMDAYAAKFRKQAGESDAKST